MVQLTEIVQDNGTARICADGSLVADVRAARTGIQHYAGFEVDPENKYGLRDQTIVNVYRPESEVFSRDSMASFAAAPLTIDHPSEPVTAANWSRYGKGEVNGDVVRDGEYVRVPIIVRDSSAVDKVNRTHKQLSMGYTCTLDAAPGKTAEGVEYQLVQRNIKINHIAAVPAGRGGPELKIKDERTIQHKRINTMKIMLDGLHVDLTDAEAVKAAFDKVKGDADKAIAANAKELADAKADVATLTTEKVALEKQVADAKAVDLDKLVADRAELVAKAKALKSDIVTDGKTAEDIRKEIVSANLGDAAKDFDAAQIAAAFAVISKDAKGSNETVVHIDAQAKASAADGAANVATIRNLRYA